MPTASLSSLPAEIQSQIAEMCAEQDRCWRKVYDDLVAMDDHSMPLHFDCVVRRDAIFTFKCGFGQRYGKYMSRLDLRRLDACSVPDVVALLPLLPNIHHVILPSMPLVELKLAKECARLDKGLAALAQSSALRALWDLIERVPSLAIESEEATEDTIELLREHKCAFTHLSIQFGEDKGFSTDPLYSLAFCRTLTSLKILVDNNVYIEPEDFRDLWEPEMDREPRCQLERFEIETGFGPDGLFDFIARLAPSLQHLGITLRSPEDHEGSLGFDNTGPPFTKLRTVRVVAYKEDLRLLVASMDRRCFPALERLELITLDMHKTISLSTLRHLFPGPATDGQPGISFQLITNSPFITGDVRMYVAPPTGVVYSHRVPPRSLLPARIFTHPTEVRDTDGHTAANYIANAGGSLSSTLRDIATMVTHAVATHDAVQLARIGKPLQAAELLRVQHVA
ncbi:hypothetical protein JCM10908_002222 [Rhodotorula pacifica]|uniref:uncharacterized protein n=1 Tax=Rhodotorula pacifica TaxID=1495444 RepID=UPI00317EFD54